MSRNEEHQLPLQFAIRKQRPEMVELLIELGADPLATDGAGHTAAAYAHDPHTDRARWRRSVRATRSPRWRCTNSRHSRRTRPGALHLMARRGDAQAVQWLLDRGADPDAVWSHWGDQVTALHLAALFGHVDVIRTLLDHGADTPSATPSTTATPPAGRCTSVSKRPRCCSGGGRGRRPIRHCYGCVVDRVNVSVLLYVPVRSASLALTRWLKPSVSCVVGDRPAPRSAGSAASPTSRRCCTPCPYWPRCVPAPAAAAAGRTCR